ncbi:helix-turn-helix domain-containing protein [Dactylosporangium sp. NPDC049525]|uniref:helix-turn-helix domain-containing protein n=1 Tax=Dactylosporangium sp. NPDC049525 TaxID=3154730 RepID=UPI003434C63F
MQRSELGPRLRALRVRAGLTIEALAEVSGVSVRAISDTERGRSRAPQPWTVAALAAGLGLAPADAEAFIALGRSGRETTTTAGRPRSCELPRRSVHFVGRDAELAAIGRRVAAGSAAVTVLHGPPGVGKTALAIRVAEQHRDRFPDGCYYLDLRGIEPEPVTTGDALTVLLKALGVHSRQIARDEDERAGQLRAVLAGRAADVAGVTVASARAGLDELVHAGLLPPPDAAGRRRFHDLVRIYAMTSVPIGSPLSR